MSSGCLQPQNDTLPRGLFCVQVRVKEKFEDSCLMRRLTALKNGMETGESSLMNMLMTHLVHCLCSLHKIMIIKKKTT